MPPLAPQAVGPSSANAGNAGDVKQETSTTSDSAAADGNGNTTANGADGQLLAGNTPQLAPGQPLGAIPSSSAGVGTGLSSQQGVIACGPSTGSISGSSGSGASSQQSGRKSTLPVHALVHAFHCTDDQCNQKTCPETKGVLKRMRLHVEQCRSRADPTQPPECKVCKLWQALHRTRQNSNQQSHGLRQAPTSHQSLSGMRPGTSGSQNRALPGQHPSPSQRTQQAQQQEGGR